MQSEIDKVKNKLKGNEILAVLLDLVHDLSKSDDKYEKSFIQDEIVRQLEKLQITT